jgi:hypothetical protein
MTERSFPEILAERDKPGELEAMARRIERTGGCSRPIRLKGTSVDGGYVTASEPDGVLLVACGSHHKSRCPSCSSTYKGDARQLVLAGLQGGKGVPDSVASHPMAWFTLTAPSFGAVHRAKAAGPCHFGPPGYCEHGRSRHCLGRHGRDEEIIGSPLCADCYGYHESILFNNLAGELWRRVTVYAFRQLAYVLGTTEKALRSEVRLSFVKTVEFQRRGAVHLHGVIRADGIGEEVRPPPEAVTARVLCEAFVRAAYAVKVTTLLYGEKVTLGFGEQISAEPLTLDGRRKVAFYVAKYASKAADEDGVLDHRIREGELELLDLPEHTERMVATAIELGKTREHASCGRWAHAMAWKGHQVTKSRQFSTTLCKLRLARRDWRIRQAGESAPSGSTTWSFEGVGMRLEIDRMLARRTTRKRAESRYEAFIERCATG